MTNPKDTTLTVMAKLEWTPSCYIINKSFLTGEPGKQYRKYQQILDQLDLSKMD